MKQRNLDEAISFPTAIYLMPGKNFFPMQWERSELLGGGVDV